MMGSRVRACVEAVAAIPTITTTTTVHFHLRFRWNGGSRCELKFRRSSSVTSGGGLLDEVCVCVVSRMMGNFRVDYDDGLMLVNDRLTLEWFVGRRCFVFKNLLNGFFVVKFKKQWLVGAFFILLNIPCLNNKSKPFKESLNYVKKHQLYQTNTW